MKSAQLRKWMQKYGKAGILMAAGYLTMRHLWVRHRPATAFSLFVVLSMSGLLSVQWMCRSHSHVLPIHASGEASVSALVMPEHSRAWKEESPILPHGRPLFLHTTKVLRAGNSWSWDGGYCDFGWLSDTELFFAEMYESDPGGRIQRSHLYRYNVLTGRKTHLKRLEKLVDCFYHSQVEVSPDGKWLLWHGGTDEMQTMDVARFDGRHHRQWPRDIPEFRDGFYALHGLRWTPDSRHWIEFKRDDGEGFSSHAIVHDIYRPDRNQGSQKNTAAFDSIPEYYAIGEKSVSMECPNDGQAIHSVSVKVTLLPPHGRQERTSPITLPANLPHPNIREVILSPDAKRIAMIVGYDNADPKWGDVPLSSGSISTPLREQTALARFPQYRPLSIFAESHPEAIVRPYCLLVCRSDGSDMHEVGTWLEEADPKSMDVENLRWLPSGKGLSLFCNDVLYTVPADE